MSRKIGSIGDWSGDSQSGSGRFVSRFYMFRAMSNPGRNLRRGSSGHRIATLRDTSHPDPPARHHLSDDDDDEESGREQGESWFAGGERRFAFIMPSTSTSL